jgi:hypothetical protein
MEGTTRGKRSVFPIWGLAVLSLALGGCTQQITGPSAGAGVGSQLSVERFLQASNERDLGTMARIFGTYDGPVADTGGTFGCFFKKIGSWFGGESCVRRQDVEIRMAVIADIMDQAVQNREDQAALDGLRARSEDLCRSFPLYPGM